MGYFDGLADASFKKDEAGNNFYYPWGAIGSGYQLKSEDQKNQIRAFVKKWYMVSLPAIILSQVLINAMISLSLLVIFSVWYFISIKKMTQGLEKSGVKLQVFEAYRNSAKSHNIFTLVFFEIILIVAIFFSLSLVAKESGLRLLGLGAFIVFCGFCAFAIGYMINSKLQSK